MSESLRDQLMQAGFKEKTPAAKPKSRRSGSAPGSQAGAQSGAHSGKAHSGKEAAGARRKKRSGGSTSAAATTRTSTGKREPATAERRRPAAGLTAEQTDAIEQRKLNKSRIRALIEANRVTEHAGDSAYRFTQGSRIKQLFVSEPVRQQLIAGELLITRLNGSTHLVPPAIGEAILAINPEWAMVHPGAASSADSASDIDDEYADYQVPDDLQW